MHPHRTGLPAFSLAYEKTHLQKWDLVHQGRTHSILLECAKDEPGVVCPAALSSLVGKREPSLPVRPFETEHESHMRGENRAPTFVWFFVV